MKHTIRAGLSGATVLAVLLTGCGSSADEDPKAASSSSPTASAEPDFVVAHERWHAMLDAGKDVNTAQQAVNAATRKFLDANPKGDLADPAIAGPLAELEEAIGARDVAIEELDSDPTVDTPELKEAWQALQPVNQEFNQEGDGFFLNQPLLQKALRGCGALFGKMKTVELEGAFGVDAYNKERYQIYRGGADTCFDPMEQLSTAESTSIKGYASGWFGIHQKRLALLKKAADGKVTMKQMRNQYVALGNQESKLKFDPQSDFNRLSPNAQMSAFDKAIHAAPGVPKD